MKWDMINIMVITKSMAKGISYFFLNEKVINYNFNFDLNLILDHSFYGNRMNIEDIHTFIHVFPNIE